MGAFLVLCIFFVYSVAYNIFGVLANNIIESCGISLSSAGVLQGMFQIGALCAMALSPLALKKLKSQAIFRWGVVLDMLGMALIFTVRTSWGVFLFFALMGLGGFFIDSGANAYLSGNFPEKRSSLIPILHFSYSLGALLCGYLILPFKSNDTWRIGYFIAAAVMLLLLLIGFVSRKNPKTELSAKESEKKKEPVAVPVKTILKDKVFIMYCLVLVFYMASQQTCTSWLPLFLEKDFGASNAVVAATTMSFWIGIAAMRLLSPVMLKTGKINALQTTSWGLALSFVGMIGVVIAGNATFALVCAVICGFGAGATIPLFIVEVAGWYPGNTGFISTFYILCGTVGRMVFPYLVAFFGDRYGMRIALGASSVLLLAATVLSFVVQVKTAKRKMA